MFYSRWGGDQSFDRTTDGLSILDLVKSGTLDCRLAGLLWLLMEQSPSLMVAAGPSFAGKSTLMHAILDFLPPDRDQINLLGYYETFKFLDFSRPEKSYLVTEEVSDHQYEYLWGVKAIRAFNLTLKGYPLGGTVHARTAEEVVYILNKWLGLPPPIISQLGVIVVLRARNGKGYYDEPIRRVHSVNLVLNVKEGLAIQVLAARQYTEKGFDYLPENDLQTAIASKYSIGKSKVALEIEAREHYLRHLRKKGQTSRPQIRNAVADFYKSRLG